MRQNSSKPYLGTLVLIGIAAISGFLSTVKSASADPATTNPSKTAPVKKPLTGVKPHPSATIPGAVRPGASNAGATVTPRAAQTTVSQKWKAPVGAVLLTRQTIGPDNPVVTTNSDTLYNPHDSALSLQLRSESLAKMRALPYQYVVSSNDMPAPTVASQNKFPQPGGKIIPFNEMKFDSDTAVLRGSAVGIYEDAKRRDYLMQETARATPETPGQMIITVTQPLQSVLTWNGLVVHTNAPVPIYLCFEGRYNNAYLLAVFDNPEEAKGFVIGTDLEFTRQGLKPSVFAAIAAEQKAKLLAAVQGTQAASSENQLRRDLPDSVFNKPQDLPDASTGLVPNGPNNPIELSDLASPFVKVNHLLGTIQSTVNSSDYLLIGDRASAKETVQRGFGNCWDFVNVEARTFAANQLSFLAIHGNISGSGNPHVSGLIPLINPRTGQPVVVWDDATNGTRGDSVELLLDRSNKRATVPSSIGDGNWEYSYGGDETFTTARTPEGAVGISKITNKASARDYQAIAFTYYDASYWGLVEVK